MNNPTHKAVPKAMVWHVLLVLLAGWLVGSPALALESICAQVKIEVRQELALERQGFDAHMRITNGLDTDSLTGVQVDIIFADATGALVRASSDPDDTQASFFIQVSSLEGIDAVDGTGEIAPRSSADIHWLIIPAPGSGGEQSAGKLYYVGAALSYQFLGTEQSVDVAPDYIYVKPLPLLALDYFLTHDVYADDAFTTEIEPAEPFTLGLRAKNNGHAVARNVRIETAQPRIVENEQGLSINFQILSGSVDDQSGSTSLLLNLGEIGPDEATVARWEMVTGLSGQFVAFDAQFSHANELGGALTSLVDAAVTHSLVRNVIVDLPGRDAVRDFLALDGDVLRVYESNGVDTEVVDQSGSAALEAAGQAGAQRYYQLTAPATGSLLYVRLPDPQAGAKRITRAVRSDGKRLPLDNVWISKTRRDDNGWDYFVNLFDVASTGRYTLTMDDPPTAPVLAHIPDQRTYEGGRLSFQVQASDPNGTVPSLSAAPLPSGATFTDQGDGTGVFDWSPTAGQAAGSPYAVTFTASDGTYIATQAAHITVCPADDTDCDGMNDAWELAHFGTLDRDGSGDFDGDGISDRAEHDEDTDPEVPDLPGTPTIISPVPHEEVTDLQPSMVIGNSTHRPEHSVQYQYEVYSDPGMTDLAASATVPETPDTTSWQVQPSLQDNHWYDWRVRADNGFVFSPWANGDFFVNTENDAPGPFQISSPANGSDVATLTPALEVTNSVDVDGDVVSYGFQVYADIALTNLVAGVDGIPAGLSGHTSWSVDTELVENAYYYWHVTATDEHGASTDTEVGEFFVNTYNDAPGAPVLVAPYDGEEAVSTDLDLVMGNAVDPDSGMLDYYFELDTLATFDSPDKRVSGLIAEGSTTTSWFVDMLADNTWYHWRAKASDGFADGPWVQGSFFVNTENDPPSVPTVRNPDDGSWVETRTPALELNASTDPDWDELSYRFELYDGADLSTPLAMQVSATPEWVVDSVLADNHWYTWRAQSQDEHGTVSEWTGWNQFFVNENGVDDPPGIQFVQPAQDVDATGGTVLIRWEDSDPDSNAQIALYYDTDDQSYNGTLIVDGLEEDASGAGDEYLWDVSGLPSGTYHIYGLITDGNSDDYAYALGTVTIASQQGGGGITVMTTSQQVTTEAGVSATFTLVLDSAPSADVSIGISSADPTEGVAEPAVLVFTPLNWSVPQTVTVTGVNDCPIDGDVAYSIVIAPAASSDPQYSGVDAADVALVNLDNDTTSTSADLQVCNYTLVSTRRVTRVLYDYTYEAELTNTGPPVTGVIATVTSTSPNTGIVDGEVQFGPVASGGTVQSSDTFTIRQDRQYPFDPGALMWDPQPMP